MPPPETTTVAQKAAPTPVSQQSTPVSSPSTTARGGRFTQLKASLRGHDFATQVQMLSPEHGATPGATAIHQAAANGIQGYGSRLPHADKIQRSFGGFDVSNVQTHAGAHANAATAAMGADAYATGNHVVLGQGGQDLHTVAHEAAHVVQQRHGVSLSGGVGTAGDPYERHADAVADLVVQGKSAEGLLGQMAGGGSGQAADGIQTSACDEPPSALAAPTSTSVANLQCKEGGDSPPDRNGEELDFFSTFAAAHKLSAEDRQRLEVETGARMGIAFTKYTDACNSHIAAMRSAATRNRDIFLVIADVALALLAPGGGKALAGLVNSLPVSSPTTLYALALPIMDNASTIVGAAFTGGKRAAGMAFENAQKRPRDEDFIQTLKQDFSVVLQDARGRFAAMRDPELAVLCAAFDARVVTEQAYSAQIGNLLAAFKNEIEPIGKTEKYQVGTLETDPVYTSQRGVVAVTLDGGAPVLVGVQLTYDAETKADRKTQRLKFRGFVDPRLRDMAVEAASRTQSAGIQVLSPGRVEALPKLPETPVARL